MRYEIEVKGQGANVQIGTVNLGLDRLKQRVKENDAGLERFLTRNKLGWATMALVAGKAVKDIADGSTFLTDALKAPSTLLGAFGSALDIGFAEEGAAFEGWLARTQADIISWGAALGESDDKAAFFGDTIGKLAGKTISVTIKTIIEGVKNFDMGDIIDEEDIASRFKKGVTKGILEGFGVDSKTAEQMAAVQMGTDNWTSFIRGDVDQAITTGLGSLDNIGMLEGGGNAPQSIRDIAYHGIMGRLGPVGWFTDLVTGGGKTASGFATSNPDGSPIYYDENRNQVQQPKTITVNNYYQGIPTDPDSLAWSQKNALQGVIP